MALEALVKGLVKRRAALDRESEIAIGGALFERKLISSR